MRFSLNRLMVNGLLVLSILATLVIGGIPALAIEQSAISLESKSVANGATFTVDLDISTTVQIAGAQSTISFDPAKLRANSVNYNTDTPFFGEGQHRISVSIANGKIDNTAGIIQGITSITGGTTTVTGNGLWATLSFTALTDDCVATLVLSPDNSFLADTDAEAIPTDKVNGTITIGEPSQRQANPAPDSLSPVIRIEGPTGSIPAGSSFDVVIDLSSAQELRGWQTELTFPSDILAANSVSWPVAYQESDPGFFYFDEANNTGYSHIGAIPDNVNGKITALAGSLEGHPGLGQSGMGNLVTINFSVKPGIDNIYVPLTLSTAGAWKTILVSQDGQNEVSAITIQDQTLQIGNPGQMLTLTANSGVSVSPNFLEVENGSSFIVDLVVDTETAIRGWQLDVNFDASKVYCTGVTQGNFVSAWTQAHGASTFSMPPQINNTTGAITGICCAIMGASGGGPSGTGALCTLSFTAQPEVNDYGEIVPLNITLLDIDINNIPGIMVSAGVVAVGDIGGRLSPPPVIPNTVPVTAVTPTATPDVMRTDIGVNGTLILSGGDEVAAFMLAAESDYENESGVDLVIRTTSDYGGLADLAYGDSDIAMYSGPDPPPMPKPRVGAFWVSSYVWDDDLPNSGTLTTEFVNTLTNNGYSPSFNKGDDHQVVENDFQSRDDPNFSPDAVDIFWFSGHGDPGTLCLKNDSWLIFDRVCYGEVFWGEYDVDWMFFHACHTLYDDYAPTLTLKTNGEFPQSMNGVHLICGAHTVMRDNPGDGQHVAEFLTGTNHPLLSVKDSWFWGIDENYMLEAIQLRVISEDPSYENDYIWGEGPGPAPDVQVDDYYITYDHTCSNNW